MIIVTSGAKYVDIDAYAGCIAYAELLELQGKDAQAVITAPLNQSICNSLRQLKAKVITSYSPSGKDEYVLIDVSDPGQFESFVDIERVVKVIDHHPGHEAFWNGKIGNSANIDFIGAACTLVYENWMNARMLDKISSISSRLLLCGILDNTLNFKAQVTTRRDIDAYQELIKHANVPSNWASQYFAECQEAITENIEQSVLSDTKTLQFHTFNQPITIGQLALWDGAETLAKYGDSISDIFEAIQSNWFMNLISISEGKSYLYTGDIATQKWLTKLLGVRFDGRLAECNRTWLEKEITKQDITANME